MTPLPRLTLAALALCLGPAALHAAPAVEDTMAQRVMACTGCHGPEGRAAPDGYYPRIAGKPAGYLYNQLLNFREGRRHYLPMVRLVDPLSNDYLREIAEHFASLDLPYAPAHLSTASPAVLARGEALVRQGDPARKLPACAQCHGEALTGVTPAVPGLLGLPRDYLNGQLGAWRTGARRAQAPDCMAQVAQALAPEDIGAVSSWLAAQAPPAHAQPASGLAAPMPLPCGTAGGAAR
ncbi:MAG: c-type cytochrome [Rhizobacter sp.]|nr:c-type cytochrome [Rhizobacter sp.]